MNYIIYILLSVIIVSLISVLAATPLLLNKKISKSFLILLLSLSVGILLGTVFVHFIPEIFAKGYNLKSAIYILLGFILFLIIENLVHSHHKYDEYGHGHAYHLAPLNLIGDGIHNFLDGLIIAGSYTISIPLGIASTVSVIFHEIPQEIADFGVLLYSGLSKKKALLFNFISATTAIIGAIVGIFLAYRLSDFILPFATGNFIYIAASNLVPELHRHSKPLDIIQTSFFILLGIAIIIGLDFIFN